MLKSNDTNYRSIRLLQAPISLWTCASIMSLAQTGICNRWQWMSIMRLASLGLSMLHKAKLIPLWRAWRISLNALQQSCRTRYPVEEFGCSRSDTSWVKKVKRRSKPCFDDPRRKRKQLTIWLKFKDSNIAFTVYILFTVFLFNIYRNLPSQRLSSSPSTLHIILWHEQLQVL